MATKADSSRKKTIGLGLIVIGVIAFFSGNFTAATLGIVAGLVGLGFFVAGRLKD